MTAASPENVSDLIAKPREKYDPEPRHVSKYLKKIIRAEKRGKSAHKTLGVATVDLDSPLEYLKKGTGIVPKRPQVHHQHYHRPGYQRSLPEWQPIKASEIDKQISISRIDFMKRNVDEAKNLRPSKPRMYYIDDRHGNAHPLKKSGMYPLYINRKDYGQVPTSIAPIVGGKGPGQRQKPADHPRGQDNSKWRSRQKTKSPRRERPRQKTKSPQREDKLRGKPKQKTKSPQREDKLREKPKQKTTDPQGKDKLRGRDLQQKSMDPKGEEELTMSQWQKSTNSQGKDESKEQQNGDKENDNEGEKTMMKIKSKEDDDGKEVEDDGKEVEDDGKEVEDDENVNSDDDEEKELKTISRGDYQQPRCRYVTEDERAELLYGMKKKWDEMMKIFQCLPFLTDTQPKAKRKSGMEKDLLQLEKDIEIIERHPYIYVYSDDDED